MGHDSESSQSNPPAESAESASTMLVSSLAGHGQIVSDRFRIGKIDEPFRQIIAKCLKDDPGDRWQDLGDLRIALELVSHRPLQKESQLKIMRRRNVLLVAAILIALTALSMLITFSRPPSSTAHIEFQMLAPAGTQFLTIEQGGPAVVSSDGDAVAFVARDQNGRMERMAEC